MNSRHSVRTAIWLLSLSLVMVIAAISPVVSIAEPHGKNDWPVPEEAKKMPNPVPRTDAALAAAKEIFNDQCASCHGEGGKGDGPDAPMYSVKPADLTDAHMGSEMTDGEIFYKISEGRKPMPTFKKTLTDEQRWQLVHYVRAFAPKPEPATAKKAPLAKKRSVAVKKAPAKSPKP
jgi:mono/diheme cytochrome c family protein